MCGGTSRVVKSLMPSAGLSPRVRGNPPRGRMGRPECRSIPACAGEPPTSLQLWRRSRVYPPRVRGNLDGRDVATQGAGSIPACAGEPDPGGRVSRQRAVYPRVCGGTGNWWEIHGGWGGLSPRVRGNPARCIAIDVRPRSIPACAGEPDVRVRATDANGVYPRVCGGTSESSFWFRILPGLSPRVRGNRAGH